MLKVLLRFVKNNYVTNIYIYIYTMILAPVSSSVITTGAIIRIIKVKLNNEINITNIFLKIFNMVQ